MSHWYFKRPDATVEPRHFVEMTTKVGTRSTRITDVKKWWRSGELVVPSVTTVLNVLAAPALTTWKIDQHLEQAFHISKDGHTLQTYIRHVKDYADAQMSKAPEAGTDMHKVLEDRMHNRDTPPEWDHVCDAVMQALEPLSEDEWQMETYFVHPSGFGGCADLVGNGWVIDYKTKQTADKFKPGKMVYDNQSMQLAAYRMGFDMPQARCANIFICLENGEIDFHEHSQDDLDRGWLMFQHALAVWKLQNRLPDNLLEAI
jgi:hypothetical protein